MTAGAIVLEGRAAELVKGAYPTRVHSLPSLSSSSCTLWVKRDDETHPLYGGNKVRKLERLLPDALARGKRRIVTVGAAGSHHVLATAVFGARAGLRVEAMLVPQRRTAHVEESLLADLTQGLVAHPRRSFAGAAVGLVARSRGDGYLVPMGGSNVLGSMGYVDAALELRAQIEAGALPEPDLVVVTLGSGGTAAGLAAGFAACGLRCRVLGVVVATPAWLVELYARWLTRRCFEAAGGGDVRALDGRLSFTRRYLGAGYGETTDEGARALETAASVGLTLDPTYTAKAFAAALDVVSAGEHRNVLYWHTLSSAPMGPLVSERELPSGLPALLKSGA